MDELDDDQLEALVDACVDKGDYARAIEAQRAVIARHEEDSARDRGVDLERLGDLLIEHYQHEEDEDGRGPTNLLTAADETYRKAHAWYVAATGPSSVDALDALAGRAEAAATLGRKQVLYEVTMQLAAAAEGVEGKDRAGAAKAIRRAVYCALGQELRKPVAALAKAESALTGEPVIDRQVVVADGPARLEFDDPPKRRTGRASVGRELLREHFSFVSAGGAAEGLEISLGGEAVEQGLLEPPVVIVQRGTAKSRRFRGRVLGGRLVANVPITVGAKVENEARLYEVGYFGLELDDALSQTRFYVELEIPGRQRGKGKLEIRFAPEGHPGGAIGHELQLTVAQPRGVEAEPSAPPKNAQAPSTPVVRRRRSVAKPTEEAPDWKRRSGAARVLFERAEEDADLRIELQRRLPRLSSVAQRVLHRIVAIEDGPAEVVGAALEVEPGDVGRAFEAIDEWLAAIETC